MNKPFIIAKEVPKELAELIRKEVEANHPLARISLNKRRDELWSVYCSGINNFAIKKDEILLLAVRVMGDWEDSHELAQEALRRAIRV